MRKTILNFRVLFGCRPACHTVDVTSMVRQIPLITEIMDQLPAFKSLRMEGNGLSGEFRYGAGVDSQ